MDVIGAGCGRSGTLSLKAALEQVGPVPDAPFPRLNDSAAFQAQAAAAP
jgi:hypothetical protein